MGVNARKHVRLDNQQRSIVKDKMNVQRLSREGVGSEKTSEKVATYYFYTLLCPKTKDVKYVGRTVNPAHRLSTHISEAKTKNKNKRERWIVSLLRQNLKPDMKIIWSGEITEQRAIHLERWMIRHYRKKFDLKNLDDRALGGSYSTKPVYQYSLDGAFIAGFNNAGQAMLQTGVKDCNIGRCCKNENGYGTKTAGDYFWSFIKYKEYPHKFLAEWRKLKGKRVYCITGEGERKEFDTARIAAKEMDVNFKHISSVCNGKRKTAGGMLWGFVC